MVASSTNVPTKYQHPIKPENFSIKIVLHQFIFGMYRQYMWDQFQLCYRIVLYFCTGLCNCKLLIHKCTTIVQYCCKNPIYFSFIAIIFFYVVHVEKCELILFSVTYLSLCKKYIKNK